MTQDVNITIQDGGLGILPPSSDDVQAVIGCSSSGTELEVLSTRSIDELVDTFGHGPLVEAAAFSIQQSGAPVLAVKVPNTTAGAASAVTKNGAGTSAVTLSGTPYDTYDAIVEVVTGGTIGSAGCVIKYSLDGGETYSANVALGTATTYAIPNTGITLNFAAGTLIAGNTYTFTTEEPLWAAADLQDAIDVFAAGVNEFSFMQIIGKAEAADAIAVDGKMTELATALRYSGALMHARDKESGDASNAAWRTAISTDFASFSSKRVSVSAGHYMITSPISGRRYRRPLSMAVAARLCARPIHIDPGWVRDGALGGVGYSTSDGKLYHDERVNPGLDTARFMTARTYIGRPGLFVTNPMMMAPPGSDFIWWQYRRVIDKACKITREVLLDYLGGAVRLNTSGFILERDALELESRLRSAFRDGIVAKGHASAVSAVVSRVDNIISTKTISVTIRVTPLGYVKAFEVDLGFTNPALSIAA